VEPWGTVGNKGFVGMYMGLDKPRQHQLASDVERSLGRRINPGRYVPDTAVLDGDILLLTGNQAAAEKEIVHRHFLAWLRTAANARYC
jgi:hypothetical protein